MVVERITPMPGYHDRRGLSTPGGLCKYGFVIFLSHGKGLDVCRASIWALPKPSLWTLSLSLRTFGGLEPDHLGTNAASRNRFLTHKRRAVVALGPQLTSSARGFARTLPFFFLLFSLLFFVPSFPRQTATCNVWLELITSIFG
jgi:hypothetical protein